MKSPKIKLNKTRTSLITSSFAMLTMASITTAQATNNAHSTTKNDIGYIGIKTGVLNINNDQNASSIDNAKQLGGVLGYKLNKSFGVEVDYSITTDTDVVSKYNGDGEYKVTSYGMYLTYYYPFSEGFYAKSKLGVAGAEIDETYISAEKGKMKVSSDDVGIAGGIALGYDLPYNISIEGELNLLRSDNIDTNALMVAMKYRF